MDDVYPSTFAPTNSSLRAFSKRSWLLSALDSTFAVIPRLQCASAQVSMRPVLRLAWLKGAPPGAARPVRNPESLR
jgi:hypothetical protein